MSDDHNGHDHDEVDQSAAATTLVEDPSPNVVGMDETELAKEQRAFLTDKIRFVWRPEDESILGRIELAADQQFQHLYADAFAIINNLYAALRVPDGAGSYVVDPHSGRFLERWDQLTGTDIERAIMDLAAVKMAISPEVNKLKSRAVYAKMVADDAKDESYRKVVSGTIGDRTARANRDSRTDRYHAFFNYHLWSVADTFLKEVIDLMWHLKNIRNWRVSVQA